MTTLLLAITVACAVALLVLPRLIARIPAEEDRETDDGEELLPRPAHRIVSGAWRHR